MKSTGITRRIDDLGRIVIPKEIRRNLKIKDNEILEIFIDHENIILKKFSSFDDMNIIFDKLIKVLEEETLNNVLITNRDKIICTSKKDYLNKEIGSDILDIIKTKTKKIFNKKDIVELSIDDEINMNCYINPIMSNGDVLGTVVLFGLKNIEEKDIIMVDLISKLIINYID